MTTSPIELYYEERGSGYPLILIHGFPLDHSIWEPVLPILEQHARVILPDLRGHGRSPVVKEEYSIRDMADDIEELMNRLGISRAVVVGHSMGGYVALAFARAYPQKLAGLGLVASQAVADTPERRQSRFVTAEKVKHKGSGVVAENMAETLTDDPAIQAQLLPLMMKIDPNGVIGALKAMANRPDATEYLADIQAPALVILGKEDKIIAHEVGKLVAQLLPKGWSVEVEGVGHVPMLEKPEVTAGAIKELVKAAETMKPEQS